MKREMLLAFSVVLCIASIVQADSHLSSGELAGRWKFLPLTLDISDVNDDSNLWYPLSDATIRDWPANKVESEGLASRTRDKVDDISDRVPFGSKPTCFDCELFG